MSIALVITDRNTDSLVQALKNNQPGLNIQVWPNINNPETVTFAVLWKQPKGILKTFPNLKAVTSLGAGVDFILNDKSFPKQVKISRIVTNHLQQQMAQYILSYVLQDYRQISDYQEMQQSQIWKIKAINPHPTIGFLGFGKLAKFVAQSFAKIGFNIIAFTNSSTDKDFICEHGNKGLQKVMSQSDYIICLLPLTKNTRGILNTKTFSYCKKQPMLIHVGRGEQLVETDLILALKNEKLKHAVIDVFETEPLPTNHPFWLKQNITITPHNSARSDIKQTANEIIRRYNQTVSNLPLDLEIKIDY